MFLEVKSITIRGGLISQPNNKEAFERGLFCWGGGVFRPLLSKPRDRDDEGL